MEFAMIFVLIFAIVALVCAFRESKITAVYKANKVYGRLTAYLALDFTLAGAIMAVGGIASLFTEEGRAVGIGQVLGMAAMGLVIAVIGVFLYIRAYKKCPPALQKKCIVSMIVTGLGVSMKLCVFFLPFVWKLSLGNVSVSAPATETKTEVWRENGMLRENLKVNSTGDMYYDPEDGEWHKIQK